MRETQDVDRTTFAPFIFVGKGERCQFILLDDPMIEKFPVFMERDGWLGNGYDWTSIARTAVAEQLPDLQDMLSFNPEAGMFVAYGPRAALQSLAAIMSATFHDDSKLRDFLSRSTLD